jgi:hypothetical protein
MQLEERITQAAKGLSDERHNSVGAPTMAIAKKMQA